MKIIYYINFKIDSIVKMIIVYEFFFFNLYSKRENNWLLVKRKN
jgi:hypothetical protein